MRFEAGILAALMTAACYIGVPYPYCYYLSSSGEDADEVQLHFTRNPFFPGCSERKNVFMHTAKGVAVYLDEELHTRYRARELCLPESSSR